MKLWEQFCLVLVVAPAIAWGQSAKSQSNFTSVAAGYPISQNVQADGGAGAALDQCHVYAVKGLPGSHRFGSDFIEALAVDPGSKSESSETVWALTADLSDELPDEDRAMYLSKSTDGGRTWTSLAQLDSRYFDASIGEGLRNHLAVSPGGRDFVVTTQLGAFQVIPGRDPSNAVVKPIAGPRVPSPITWLNLPKASGDPVTAGVVAMMPDGKRMFVSYGYFDLHPQLVSYHRNRSGGWVEDGLIPHFPTEMDILSLQFDNAGKMHPAALYVGTGDQAYRLDLLTKKWTQIDGVGEDSAIHGMSTVNGLHIAACWAVYEPLTAVAVRRVTDAKFLLHRFTDEAGPDLRAYGIEVDPAAPSRQVVTSITGVYVSDDGGKSWRRLNDLPEGEYHTAHFNRDGSVILSGLPGTFLANPFSNACSPHLRVRER